MKLQQYMDIHDLHSDEDLRLHLRQNALSNCLPVAIYSCPQCNEILSGDLCCPACAQTSALTARLPQMTEADLRAVFEKWGEFDSSHFYEDEGVLVDYIESYRTVSVDELFAAILKLANQG